MPEDIRDIVCTACPQGCALRVHVRPEDIMVDGAGCRLGQGYGVAETTDPRRVLTTTVAVADGKRPVVSVRSRSPVPRTSIAETLRALRGVKLQAPVLAGQMVLEGSDASQDIITTAAVSEQT